MGKPTGFMEFDLFERPYKPVIERIQHYHEFFIPLNDAELTRQGARCMDCGIPYCQQGCPVDNIIPDWNDLVYRGDFAKASKILHSTNNFPEFTGRVCPAPCQEACTLNIQDTPVTIKTIECAIVDRAWQEGWLAPLPAAEKTSKKVAVVGSGPAGMACAQQLARAGHSVTLFEKNQKIGGLLRYGIPDFKMEKHLIDRRGEQMQGEGVTLETGVHVGVDISAETLLTDFDAVALTGGSEAPRDLPVDGRDLNGVHFAMDFLVQQNRRVSGEPLGDVEEILATGRNVIVIGGGDTGSDCVGTSIRQGAKNVVQIEIMPKPPEKVDKGSTWPEWPMKLRTSSSHQEGAVRDWAITTDQFIGEDGHVHALDAVRVEWKAGDDGRLAMSPVADTRQSLKAELVLLAMGFVHPTKEGMITDLGVGLDGRGNVEANTNDYQTSVAKVFAAGDMRRGQSLVVWAIREGRQCAAAIDEYLIGQTLLPR
ncbi:MAG: glutamate synthase subunit beta [Rhodospirillaceae bacterium]|mgnify:CR=1 FL=1|jgi:glutamate synthase (NADPH/NADH) small chain|nr:glutamate synthase subunit beta [Rhodospirillaceae bacterium]MBT3884996.1 glutamate synthase subunit beta [Rhodospirillaceae bacterium]MBT4118596.1 glutamate synthase subunit beta [Rhodospirillaceae bacterium]MBT4671913.1 glutamate synthase subunit beta [Rhodospirillaceae bacterium]MBT4748057.1 glutamate synthase subunit beta [Rhodospirillaceae bacterium]